MVFMWPDVFQGWGIPQIEDLNQNGFADLHVCWGAEKNLAKDYDNFKKLKEIHYKLIFLMFITRY